jgi:hypothetical protein
MEASMMNGLSPFESFMIADKQSRRPSGAAVAGLVLGTVGAAVGIGAWVFGPIVSNNRSKGIEKLVEVTNGNTQNTLDRLINALAAERSERVAQGTTISQTITDTISGQQSSSLSAQQAAELSAMQSVQQNLLNQAILGNLSENPQKVQIYSAPQPCGCPGCGN